MSEVLQTFLVKLGFEVNKQSYVNFINRQKEASRGFAKLALSFAAASASINAAATIAAARFDKIYYQSKRLNSSVKDIKAISYAIEQVGGSADGAVSAMESLASFMKNTPGGKGFIQKLIGPGFDAGDATQAFAGLSKKLAGMTSARANVIAQMLGIDPDTLRAMRENSGEFFKEYQQLIKKAGIDQNKYARDSAEFMRKIRSLQTSFSVLGEKISIALLRTAGPSIERFKKWFDQNIDKISDVLTGLVEGFVWAAAQIGTAIEEIIKWYQKLSPEEQNIVKMIGAVTAAIWLLTAAFNATPIGLILMLGAALVALYQDYQNWKETGKSALVDWKEWDGAIQSLAHSAEVLVGWLKEIREALSEIGKYTQIYKAITSAPLTGGRLALRAAYGLDGGQEEQKVVDNRSFWERNAPSWLGGRAAPSQVATRATLGGIRGTTFKEKAPAIMEKLKKDLGVNDYQAAAILGNLGHETGGFRHMQELKPLIPGSKGGFGWAQWTGPRRRAFEKFAKDHNLDMSSDEANYGFLVQELKTTHKTALNALFASKSLEQATRAFEGTYEGAGIKNYASRDTYAAAALKAVQQRQSITQGLAAISSAGTAFGQGVISNMPAFATGVNAPLLPSQATTNNSNSTLNANTTVNIMGAADPQKIGAAVEKAANNVLQRNMQSAIR